MFESAVRHIPILSFRSSGVLYYKTPIDHRNNLLKSKAFQSNSALLAKRERYIGLVTDGIKKRMKKCITLLLQSTPYTYKIHPVSGRTISHKVSFITLTTPTHEKSYDARWCHKNLLEPMLRTLRRKYYMKSYIWKVELQGNGQIHYHITADIVINHSHLKDIWNNLLRANSMLNDFKEKYGHDNPNSTDIHNVQKVNNLEAYLVKYICKEYQNESKINGKIWDCSQNLKSSDYFKLQLDHETHQQILQLQETKQVKTLYFDRAIFLDFKTNDYYAFFNENIINNFYKYLKEVRSWTIQSNSVNQTLKPKLSIVSELLGRQIGTVKEVCYQRTLPWYIISRQDFMTALSNDIISLS